MRRQQPKKRNPQGISLLSLTPHYLLLHSLNLTHTQNLSIHSSPFSQKTLLPSFSSIFPNVHNHLLLHQPPSHLLQQKETESPASTTVFSSYHHHLQLPFHLHSNTHTAIF